MSTTTLFWLLTMASAYTTYCVIVLVESGGIAALVGSVAGAALFTLLAAMLYRKNRSTP